MKKTLLSNGICIVTEEIPYSISTAISLGIKVGARHESNEVSGISHFIEHLLFKGTKERSDPLDISGAIEQTGGYINAATDYETTVYWCKVISEHTQLALTVFFDMVRNSLFTEQSINLERQVISEEIKSVTDYPNSRAELILDEIMWPNTPLGRDIAGSIESISNIQRQDIIKFAEKNYVGNNIVVSIAGNVVHEEIVEIVNQNSYTIPSGNKNTLPKILTSQKSQRYKHETRDTEQVHMCMGFPGVGRNDPERFRIDLLTCILGDGMSSRLFNEVREKRGLAYDVGSGSSHLYEVGSIFFYADLDKKKYREGINIMKAELNRCKEDISETELEKAKSLISGKLKLRMEDTKSISEWNLSNQISYESHNSVDDIVSQFNIVTLGDLKATAISFLDFNKASIALVGPTH